MRDLDVEDDLLAIGHVEHQAVDGLRVAHAMEADGTEVVLVALGHRASLGEPGVVEAAAVGKPADRGELRPVQAIPPVLRRVHVADVNDLEVAAALRHGVRDEPAVFARDERGERGRAILAEPIRIEKDTRLTVDPVLHVEHGLVLQTAVAREEKPAASLDRDRRPGEVVEARQLGDEPIARRTGDAAAVSAFCASTHASVSADEASSSQRYGSCTTTPW